MSEDDHTRRLVIALVDERAGEQEHFAFSEVAEETTDEAIVEAVRDLRKKVSTEPSNIIPFPQATATK